MPFRRPASRAARAFRIVTALITVWCLGCTAFDPLLARLADGAGRSGMVCGEEMLGGSVGDVYLAATTDGAASADASPVQPVVMGLSSPDQASGYDCGCHSCHAVEMTHAAADAPARIVPGFARAEPQALVSVGREPLLPPPEAALQRA